MSLLQWEAWINRPRTWEEKRAAHWTLCDRIGEVVGVGLVVLVLIAFRSCGK